MSEKLLPCPFCGSDNVVRGGDDKMVAVFCGTCGACGPDEYGSSNEWNRRTPAPEGEACPTCNGVRPEFCSNAFHLASPVVPVGSGEADKMAHVLRGMVKRGTLIDLEAIDRALKLATYRQDPDDDDRAWAASQAEVIGQPVVPVGRGETLPPISLDGPHKIGEHRQWLARQLLDSRQDDAEAYSTVIYSPAMTDIWRDDVVPVGVSREKQRPLAEAIYRQVAPLLAECSEPNPEDYISAILAALRPTDTGRE